MRVLGALLDLRLHMALAVGLCIATLALVAWHAPPRVEGLGESYLIFFMHLPSAVNSLLFFLVGGAFSGAYLTMGNPRNDVYASSAVTVGLLACTICIATGSPWAKAAWGLWWIWDDPRLLSVAIMWFFFSGYLLLRWSVPEEDRRARFAAVFGIIACLTVPFVHLSIKLLGGKNHPMDVELSVEVRTTVRVGMLAFFLLYLLLFRLMTRVGKVDRTLEECRRTVYDG
jgi:heme exporter protein C